MSARGVSIIEELMIKENNMVNHTLISLNRSFTNKFESNPDAFKKAFSGNQLTDAEMGIDFHIGNQGLDDSEVKILNHFETTFTKGDGSIAFLNGDSGDNQFPKFSQFSAVSYGIKFDLLVPSQGLIKEEKSVSAEDSLMASEVIYV